MGCRVGFRAVLNQSLAFTTLDENSTAQIAFYSSAPSWNAMRESRIELELFCQLFGDHFWHILLLCLNTSLFETIATYSKVV